MASFLNCNWHALVLFLLCTPVSEAALKSRLTLQSGRAINTRSGNKSKSFLNASHVANSANILGITAFTLGNQTQSRSFVHTRHGANRSDHAETDTSIIYGTEHLEKYYHDMGCLNIERPALNLMDKNHGEYLLTVYKKMTYDWCYFRCAKKKTLYFMIYDTDVCICFDEALRFNQRGTPNPGMCNLPCSGNKKITCGGRNTQTFGGSVTFKRVFLMELWAKPDGSLDQGGGEAESKMWSEAQDMGQVVSKPWASEFKYKSFEYPGGKFLRHQKFRLKVSSGGGPFKEDSTFVVVPPLWTGATNAVSFRSANFPNYYVRHRNFEFFIDKFDDKPGQAGILFKEDATFYLIKPPDGKDDGTLLLGSANFGGRYFHIRGNGEVYLDSLAEGPEEQFGFKVVDPKWSANLLKRFVGHEIALHCKARNRYVRMNKKRDMDVSPEKGFGNIGGWKWERFLVVDAGNDEYALHSKSQKRFIRMNNRNDMDGSGEKKPKDLPKGWTWERWIPIDAGNGEIALYSKIHKRFMRMNGNRMDGTQNSALPTPLERYKILDLGKR